MDRFSSSTGDTTSPSTANAPATFEGGAAFVFSLAIAWSAREPHRVGEVATLMALDGADASWMLGREDGDAAANNRVQFRRARPGEGADGGPLVGRALSRRQLLIELRSDGLHIENRGRAKLFVNRSPCEQATVAPGDVIDLRGHYVFLVAMRPAILPPTARGEPSHAFGEPDRHGILGESPASWRLRDALAFAATANRHVLLHGESGTGKELAARSLHALSARASGPFVARNAATMPTTLVDAELFGNAKNYPNAGMPERAGLVGEANGGTLFLDEIGELPSEVQTHLLRFLDSHGEYHRLGEAQPRRSDVRLVGATNRALTVLKHDLLARLTLVIELPSLDERREDIPLLARHLVLHAARTNPEIAERFVRRDPRYDEVRFAPGLVAELLRRSYPANVRELDKILWQAMAVSMDGILRLPDDLRHAQRSPGRAPDATEDSNDDVDQLLAGLSRARPSAEAVRESLLRHQGNVQQAARALGVSRWALERLMKKHGIRRQ